MADKLPAFDELPSFDELPDHGAMPGHSVADVKTRQAKELLAKHKAAREQLVNTAADKTFPFLPKGTAGKVISALDGPSIGLGGPVAGVAGAVKDTVVGPHPLSSFGERYTKNADDASLILNTSSEQHPGINFASSMLLPTGELKAGWMASKAPWLQKAADAEIKTFGKAGKFAPVVQAATEGAAVAGTQTAANGGSLKDDGLSALIGSLFSGGGKVIGNAGRKKFADSEMAAKIKNDEYNKIVESKPYKDQLKAHTNELTNYDKAVAQKSDTDARNVEEWLKSQPTSEYVSSSSSGMAPAQKPRPAPLPDPDLPTSLPPTDPATQIENRLKGSKSSLITRAGLGALGGATGLGSAMGPRGGLMGALGGAATGAGTAIAQDKLSLVPILELLNKTGRGASTGVEEAARRLSTNPQVLGGKELEMDPKLLALLAQMQGGQ